MSSCLALAHFPSFKITHYSLRGVGSTLRANLRLVESTAWKEAEPEAIIPVPQLRNEAELISYSGIYHARIRCQIRISIGKIDIGFGHLSAYLGCFDTQQEGVLTSINGKVTWRYEGFVDRSVYRITCYMMSNIRVDKIAMKTSS